jgi:outer membrane protein assembly factor BamB
LRAFIRNILERAITDLQTAWTTSLPECGYSVTSSASTDTVNYFGCNGRVVSTDNVTGAVRAQNGLPGTGEHEVRLAIARDQSVVLVGTNGYALGLNPQNLNTTWSISLPGCGYKTTSVLESDGVAFLGCNGQVYRINITTGELLSHNDLPGMGNHEVNLGKL